MKTAFSFFLRLFFCLVGAKFFLRVLCLDGLGFLLGFTALLLANVYFFDYLEYRDRLVFRRPRKGGEAGPEPPPPAPSSPR
jgi:hypothetical protein